MARLAGGYLVASMCVLMSPWSRSRVGAQEGHATVGVEAEASLSAEGEPEAPEGHETHTAHETAGHEAHEHHPLALGFDFVLGFGAFPTVLETKGPPGSPPVVEDVPVISESLVLSGGYEVAEHVGVGLRVPLTVGSVPEATGTTHVAFALGNIELEAETEIELSEAATLVLSLGVALPTAMGSEEPEFEDGEFSSAWDHFVLNRIAASSRGFEDNALFEIDRLGIVLKLALNIRANHLLILEPSAKLENLIAVNSELEQGYVAELVVGTFLGCELNGHFDLGARVWINAAFLDEIESVGVTELQVRAHYAPVDVVVGGILPFAGTLTDPQFGGVRLGLVAHL